MSAIVPSVSEKNDDVILLASEVGSKDEELGFEMVEAHGEYVDLAASESNVQHDGTSDENSDEAQNHMLSESSPMESHGNDLNRLSNEESSQQLLGVKGLDVGYITPADDMIEFEPSKMQLVRAPRSFASYHRRYLLSTRHQYLEDMPETPDPPEPQQGLFSPGGIVYLDGKWMQLSGGILSSVPEESLEQETTSRVYSEKDFELTIGWDVLETSLNPKLLEVYDPYSPSTTSNEALTPYGRLMAMEGLEEVKAEFLNVKTLIDETSRRKGHTRRQDLNLVLQGNPGTGKRTIASIYRDFLVYCRVWGDREVPLEKVSGIGFDIDVLRNKLSNNTDGVVLLIDAVEHTSYKIRAQILDCIETYAETAVVILAGSNDGVTSFLGARPHGRWQFRRKLMLKDYDDEQLHRILQGLLKRHSLEVEDSNDAYTRIAARRVGRGRNSPGFGNVHDLLSHFEKSMQRRSLRMQPPSDATLLQREPEPQKVTHYATCDGPLCQNDFIFGIRYKCTVCDDIDFCAKCEAYSGLEHDRSHPFIQFRVAIGAMNSLRYGASNYTNNENSHSSSESTEETDDKSGDSASREAKPDGSTEESQTQPKNLLTFQDIIGEEPEDIRQTSEAWKELEKMVGLHDVKKAIGELLLRAKTNYHRELRGQEPLVSSLNRVFLGPPGTGKTTVAKLYGQILADIGVLSTNEVVCKTPTDFIDEYIGGSEAKTMEILNSTVGKVLIIDDAHMLYSGSKTKGTGYSLDKFRVAIIDTLVSQLQNRPGEDRCVILLGYPDMMEEMYQNVNAGLRRRFPLEEAFRFENYDDAQLLKILNLKMEKEEVKAESAAMEVAAEVLRRARDRPNFGNGGDVENLLGQAKSRFRQRIAEETKKERLRHVTEGEQEPGDVDELMLNSNTTDIILKSEDFDPDWNRGALASAKCEALFDGLIGFEGIISKLQGYQRTAANLRLNGKDPRESIPFTFVFKGPPGTGKTHTARIIGQMFYDMGFLSTSEVVECSASQLVGQYQGQTGPTVINLFERALGKVLFIDEAYRLARGGRARMQGSFQDEAIGEIVDCMTKPMFHKKMIIVLAGYTKDMDMLMDVNAGLRSRFATEIAFPAMTAIRARAHLFNLLKKKDIEVRDPVPITIEQKEKVLRLFDKLGMTAGWAGARDVSSLAAAITEKVYRTADELSDEEASDIAPSVSGGGVGTPNGSSQSMERAKFRISTRDLTESLKDMLRERIRSGMAK